MTKTPPDPARPPKEADPTETLLAQLEAPGALGPEAPERIETHLSVVLLSGDRAFKRMRPVAYDFVDFRDPEARRRACFDECAGNPMAGDLYLGVRPVLRAETGPILAPRMTGPADAPGARRPDAVEHLVEMRRFDRAQELDRLLMRGALDAATLEALADRVAAAHAAAPATPDSAGAAAAARTLSNVALTLDQTAATRAPHLRDPSAAWADAMAARLEVLAPRLDARARHGRVRRCHGDLHLGNIALLDGEPRPFDAIVFNRALSDIDILYDAAFTVMDLRRLGGLAPASRFWSRYLSATRDYRGASALALFGALRAGVRAMVSLLNGDAQAAEAFLALGRGALAPPPPPRLIAIGGGSGAGKTTLARALAADPRLAGPGALAGPPLLRSDVARKRLLGLPPERRAPPEAYDEAVSRRVLSRLTKDAARTLAGGGSAIVDATFLGPDWRRALADAAARAGARFDGLWLELGDAERAARAQARPPGSDASDADAAIAAAQTVARPDAAGWRVIAADGPPETAHAAAVAALDL